MDLQLIDKHVGEEWSCSYNSAYLEKLTSKTGNFKTFDVFTKMLKSGLLKASRAITLNLLTSEELRKNEMPNINSYFQKNDYDADGNKRYLILAYITEFDRTFYPLSLDYRGSPDVKSLIATIRRLETELTKTREDFAAYKIQYNSVQPSEKHDEFQKRIQELTVENVKLANEVRQKCKRGATKTELAKTTSLENALLKLEKSVIIERRNQQKYVDKLLQEKKKMQLEIDTLRKSESALKQKLQQSQKSSGITSLSRSRSTVPRRSLQKSQLVSLQGKTVQSGPPSRCSKTSSGCESINSRSSSCSNGKSFNNQRKSVSRSSSRSQDSSKARSDMIRLQLHNSNHDYKVLEQRITDLQKMLLTKPK